MSAAAEQDQELQKRVLSTLEIERHLPLRKQSGPIKTLLDQEQFDEIHLIGDYPKWLRQLYTDWLNRPFTLHAVSLADPSDYSQILEAVSVLAKINRRPDADFSFLLTPTLRPPWRPHGFWSENRDTTRRFGKPMRARRLDLKFLLM